MKHLFTTAFGQSTIRFLATPLDEKACWIRVLSTTGILQPPRYLFLVKSEGGWISSSGDIAFTRAIIQALEQESIPDSMGSFS